MTRRLLFLLIAFAASVFAACPSGYVLVGGKCVSVVSRILTAPTVTLTAAQVNAMYTTPVQIVPAQGAGTVVVPLTCVYNAIYGAAFTGGGQINLVYGSGGTNAGNYRANATVAAAYLTGLSANAIVISSVGSYVTGGANAGIASPAAVNQALLLSNQTAVFAGGAGTSLVVNCQYYVVTGVQ